MQNRDKDDPSVPLPVHQSDRLRLVSQLQRRVSELEYQLAAKCVTIARQAQQIEAVQAQLKKATGLLADAMESRFSFRPSVKPRKTAAPGCE